MPIDTAAKRCAAMNVSTPWLQVPRWPVGPLVLADYAQVCNAYLFEARIPDLQHTRMATTAVRLHPLTELMQVGPFAMPVPSTRRRYDLSLRGQYRQEDTAVELYEVFRGVDGSPDFDAAPWKTCASMPQSEALAAGHEYRFTGRWRNRHGVTSRNAGETIVELDGDGNLLGRPPSAPFWRRCEAAADGAVRVQAAYNHAGDGADAADTWLIYQVDDGSDPADAEPTEVAMAVAGVTVRLDRTAGTYANGAEVRTLVRTRRSGTPDVDSENTASDAVTASTQGPVCGETGLYLPASARFVE